MLENRSCPQSDMALFYDDEKNSFIILQKRSRSRSASTSAFLTKRIELALFCAQSISLPQAGCAQATGRPPGSIGPTGSRPRGTAKPRPLSGPSRPPWLAALAEHGHALLHQSGCQWRLAGGAWQTGASIHLVQFLERSPTTIRCAVILNGASTAIHGLLQHLADDHGESIHLIGFQSLHRHAWMQSCAKQRLIDIDVPDACRHRLIKQCRLQRASRTLERRDQGR